MFHSASARLKYAAFSAQQQLSMRVTSLLLLFWTLCHLPQSILQSFDTAMSVDAGAFQIFITELAASATKQVCSDLLTWPVGKCAPTLHGQSHEQLDPRGRHPAQKVAKRSRQQVTLNSSLPSRKSDTCPLLDQKFDSQCAGHTFPGTVN